MTASVPEVPGNRILNTWRLTRDPYGFYDRCRTRHGDTFWLHAVNGRVLASGDPALVADVLRADTTEVRPFGVDAIRPLVGTNSVLTLWGPRHREERRLLTPSFHGQRMKAYGGLMVRTVDEVSDAWRDGAEIVAADAMLAVSIRVIVRAVFGVLEPARMAPWFTAVAELVDSIHPAALFLPFLQVAPFGLGPWARFVRARDALDALLHAEIRSRRAAEAQGEDILSMMLLATHEDGRSMTDDEIRDELVTLLFAGHETTQIAMSWMLYHLARDADATERVTAELDGTDGSPEALAKLPFLDAVVNETLRLEPIVPDFLRTLAVPMTLGGHALPAGAHLALLTSLVHTRPDLYPDPYRFRPERFLERKFKPHEWLPFGGGVRRCLGAALATWEMKVVVGTLLRRFRFESLSDETSVRRNVTMGARTGVRLRVTPRQGARVAAA